MNKSRAKSKDRGNAPKPTARRGRSRWWWVLHGFLIIVVLLVAARIALPYWVRSYVIRTIGRNPLYDGTIGAIHMRLWNGGYTIEDIRLNKVTGNVPVPFFSASRVHLVMEWRALLAGKLVGRVEMEQAELNFVDGGGTKENGQTGAEGSGGDPVPWLSIIRDLYPFKINSVAVHDGAIHLRAFHTKPPVDVYLSRLEATIENLTNIHDEANPLITTVHATALAMDQAKFEFNMKLDPFSYRPTFQLATRVVGLDVTQVNALSKAYGQFDFERGYFDLVVELDAKEGHVEGYIKPLFRQVTIFSLEKDLLHRNVIEAFWDALVGATVELLKNQPRDQFGTVIPLVGDLAGPQTNFLTVIGNVLRNGFIRAYLPRFENVARDLNGLEFKPGSVTEQLPIKQGP